MKNINIQNNKKGKYLLWTNGLFEIENDSIWFISFFYNCLCKYNIKNRKLEEFIEIPLSNIKHGSFYNLKKVNEILVIVPARGRNIYFYNIEKRNFSNVNFKDIGTEEIKFQTCAVWKNYIYIFPVSYPYILKIELKSQKVEYINNKLIFEMFNRNLLMFMLQEVQVKNKIYLLFYNSNKIFEFDMNTDKGRDIVIGNKENIYTSISLNENDKLILVEKKGDIFTVDLKKLNQNFIKPEIIYSCKEDMMTLDCVKIQKYLFIFPNSLEKGIHEFDLQECIMKKSNFSDFICEIKTDKNWWIYEKFSRAIYFNDKIYVMNILEKCLYEIDVKKGTVEKHFIGIEKEQKSFIKVLLRYNQIENRIERFALENFLENIKMLSEDSQGKRTNMGYKIFQKLSYGGNYASN